MPRYSACSERRQHHLAQPARTGHQHVCCAAPFVLIPPAPAISFAIRSVSVLPLPQLDDLSNLCAHRCEPVAR